MEKGKGGRVSNRWGGMGGKGQGQGAGGGRGQGRGSGGGRGRGGGAVRGGRGSERGGGHGAGASMGRGSNANPSRGGSNSGLKGGGRGGRGSGRGRSAGRGMGRGGGRKRSSSTGGGGGSSRGGGKNGKREGIGGGGEDGLPANKKRRLKMERQQHRPEFDTVKRSKEIWNKLRERKVPPEERANLVQELLSLIKGKVLAIAMKHDASRVVQTAIQFGTQEERLMILSEVEGHLVELSQLTYAHFIILRMLKSLKGENEQRRLLRGLRSEIVRLATHAVGARVVQAALDTLPSATTALIKAEFYGKEFALFDDGKQPHNLKEVLQARPDRRGVVMSHVGVVIGKLLSKGLMQFEFAHNLLWEYMKEATPQQMQDLVPQLMEAFMSLLSTRPGSLSAAMCAAYGGAKERKRMMRALKGYVAASLMHRDAYLAVVRLVDSVDDTVTCQKMVLSELLKPLETVNAKQIEALPKLDMGSTAESWVPRGISKPKVSVGEEDAGGKGKGEQPSVGGDIAAMDVENEEEDKEGGEGGKGGKEAEGEGEQAEMEMEEEKGEEKVPLALFSVAMHQNGCKVLLHLLAPDRSSYLHPEELDLLKPVMVPAPGGSKSTVTGDKPETEAVPLVPSSKKDSAVRNRELLAFLRDPLRSVCAEHAAELMRSKFAGSLVLLEVLKVIPTPELVEAVAVVACKEPAVGHLSMHEDASGHLFMKQLLVWEADKQITDASSPKGDLTSPPRTVWFADALMSRVAGKLLLWASSNRGAFVVAALETVPSCQAAVRTELGSAKAKLKLSKTVKDSKGVEVLVEQLAGRGGRGRCSDKNPPRRE